MSANNSICSRLENSTLNFKKRKHSQHEGSGNAAKKMKTLASPTGGKQKVKLIKVMRTDTAKQMKAALSVDLCTAKEQMVEEVKQTDRDACTTDKDLCTTDKDLCTTDKDLCTTDKDLCTTDKDLCTTDKDLCTTDKDLCTTDKDLCTTDHSEPVTADTVTLIVSPEVEDKQCLENGQDEELTLRLDLAETTVAETDEQAVPEVNHSHLSPVADQSEDSTDLDEDKRAIRDAEKALRSLSGDWDGEDDFFSSLDNDTGRRSKHRASKGSHNRRMGKEIKVVIEPTESTEILVNGNGFDAVEICVEESKQEQEAPQADGGDDAPSFETAAVVEDQDLVAESESESALKRDDTVEALLKIEQECACIQFLVGQQSPCPTPPEGGQQTGVVTLQGDIQEGEGDETTAVKVEKSASDGTNPPAADEAKIECTSIEAQILQSNPLLYGKLECETPPPPPPQESVEIKHFTMNTDNDTVSDMDYVKTEYLGRHNGGAVDSRIFTSDSISHDTSHIEAAQLEAAVILQEMSSKSDKEAATILQQMSIGNRDGNSAFHSSNIRTYSPLQDSYDTDNSQGTFSFHDGFRQETSSAVRPTTLDNLQGIHDSCKKGNTMSLAVREFN